MSRLEHKMQRLREIRCWVVIPRDIEGNEYFREMSKNTRHAILKLNFEQVPVGHIRLVFLGKPTGCVLKGVEEILRLAWFALAPEFFEEMFFSVQKKHIEENYEFVL